MDKYLIWCDEWIKECIRILKPMGTLYIYGFSEILAFIRVRISINVRWIIWHYTNKVIPYTEAFLKNATGKVGKATKGRFSKNCTGTFNNKDTIKSNGNWDSVNKCWNMNIPLDNIHKNM